MNVRTLIQQLAQFPSDFDVHLDVMVEPNGERLVRDIVGLRLQDGYNAVALDGGTDLTSQPALDDTKAESIADALAWYRTAPLDTANGETQAMRNALISGLEIAAGF